MIYLKIVIYSLINMEQSKPTAKNKIPIEQNENNEINIIVNLKKYDENVYNILPGYTNEYDEINQGSKSCCWNCCHNFSTLDCSIPIKYSNDIFYIYGHFCSYSCGGRFIIDNFNNQDKWRVFNLLNFMYNKINNTYNKNINPALSKFILKKFGGTLDIEEYRNNHNLNIYNIMIPPIIPIKHDILVNDKISSENDNKQKFKLYRTKPLKINNILSSMNL
tara:strand:- start:463 stop:1122 length:660 start_codon:yes stop_codon:yes gene_type:complete